MDQVEEFLAKRYAGNPEALEGVLGLYRLYDTFGLKDTKFEQDFTDGRDEHFFAYLWEMILARHLKGLGLDITSADEGPDFKINHGDQTIWVEAICPSPSGIPDEWLNPPPITDGPHVSTFPHEQILMRWTAALKEKREKLSGRIELNQETGEEKRVPGYLENGIVCPEDSYVIAISACRLGPREMDLHHGISQLPFAIEAAFPAGPIELVIDRETLEAKEQRLSYRPSIIKPNGAEIPTDSFYNPDYAGVSAIFGAPAGVNAACGDQYPIALVHNPLATSSLPAGILGVDEEFVPEKSEGGYDLRVIKTEENQ